MCSQHNNFSLMAFERSLESCSIREERERSRKKAFSQSGLTLQHLPSFDVQFQGFTMATEVTMDTEQQIFGGQ